MGKKYLSIVPMAIFSLALQGQTPSAASGTAQAQQPIAAASVSAELTRGVDTKKAKVGDEIDARVTNMSKLPDGTELPRGTKLIGKVTDVKAKSKEEKNAHLGFGIDHAVLKNGKQVPVMVAVTSITGPAQSSADMMMPGGGSSGGGASPGGSAGSAGSTSAAPVAPMMSDSGQSSTGGVLKSAQDHVPVGNMPGVVLSAATAPGSAGALDAAGENINLDSGTKLTLNVAAGASPARH